MAEVPSMTNQDNDGQNQPHGKEENGHDDTNDAGHAKRVVDGHGPQDSGQLGVGQR